MQKTASRIAARKSRLKQLPDLVFLAVKKPALFFSAGFFHGHLWNTDAPARRLRDQVCGNAAMHSQATPMCYVLAFLARIDGGYHAQRMATARSEGQLQPTHQAGGKWQCANGHRPRQANGGGFGGRICAAYPPPEQVPLRRQWSPGWTSRLSITGKGCPARSAHATFAPNAMSSL